METREDKKDRDAAGRPNVMSRRGFLRVSAVGTIAGATVLAAGRAISPGVATSPDVKAFEGPKKRYGMLIDLRKCVKCESCTVACKAENNIPVDSSRKSSRRIMWNH